ncbi:MULTISPECIES: LUD domain-containing protein [unclassified Ornithinimicrobium]|uniref:LUD domain-containing protein n=1 Tax=unclassified Ornithinimicrobium TaxID=2615080 RepID=UPI003854AA43
MSTTSRALAGMERVAVERPEWAGTTIPPHRRPLPLIVKEAVARPASAATADRLSARSREWGLGTWTGPRAEARDRAAAIRRQTLPDLEGHLAQLTTQLTSRGAHVHRAADSREALAAIDRILEPHDVQLVVKSKSMVTEEIHLNAHLQARGLDVVETDLGEYIVQIADERPAHIVAPAVHLSRQDVRARFSALADRDLGDEPADLARFARDRLREDFHRADVGISGVNFAVAETGTLVLVTNEGNADMVTSQPRIHIAVMTLEKVIADAEALSTLLPLLSQAGANQEVTVYQTFVNGPRGEGESDGPEELHLVILDNGRSSLLGTRYEDVLACIRCGACQTACPVFATAGGGHSYANVYGGPIGAVITPLLSDRPEDRDLAYLSSLCGACGDACPVKIPLPDMLIDLRSDYQDEHASRATRAGWWAWSAVWSTRLGYAATALGARVSSRVPRAVMERLPMARRWSRGRTLPRLDGAGRGRG